MADELPRGFPGKGIDLVAAALGLPPEFNTVRRKLIRLRDVNSARTDLVAAFDMFVLCEEASQRADQSPEPTGRVTQALMYSAIVLYARATKSESKHRATANLLETLTIQEREVHEEICRLRDDAVAHFGPGKNPAGVAWHEEGLFMPVDRPGDLRIMMLSRRSVIDRAAHVRFRKQAHRALMLIERRVREREDEAVDEINRHVRNPVFIAAMHEHIVETESYFGSKFEADLLLEGARVGNLAETFARE